MKIYSGLAVICNREHINKNNSVTTTMETQEERMLQIIFNSKIGFRSTRISSSFLATLNPALYVH